MALDEVLFRQMEESRQSPVLRFYYAAGPSVTVGYRGMVLGTGQVNREVSPRLAGERVSLPAVAGVRGKDDLPVVPRMTGGGRVVHGNDLILSLVARKEHDESFRSVRMSYLKIHEALKKGFESLGRGVRFYRCDENLPEGPDCFKFPMATDLALGKHKIAGGSQKRSAGTLLHQESVADCGLDGETLAAAFVKNFESVFGIQINQAALDPAWFEKANALAESKYKAVVSCQSTVISKGVTA